MGHAIEGFVLSRKTAEHLLTLIPEALIAPLRQAYVFVPLTDRLFDHLRNRYPEAHDSHHPELWKLSGPVEHILRAISAHGPIAYVETDYFGGAGEQAAAVWSGGKIVVTPRKAERGPINDALRAVGVQRIGRGDEFDTIGLGGYREMDDWEAAEEPTESAAAQQGVSGLLRQEKSEIRS